MNIVTWCTSEEMRCYYVGMGSGRECVFIVNGRLGYDSHHIPVYFLSLSLSLFFFPLSPAPCIVLVALEHMFMNMHLTHFMVFMLTMLRYDIISQYSLH